AHQLFDGVLLHVAVAAEDLHRVGRDLHANVGGEPLRVRRLQGRAHPAVDHPRRLPAEQPRRFDLRRHVGDQEVDPLVHRDRHSELHALLRVLRGMLECRARDTDCADRGSGPREIQRPHRDLEALAFLAEPAFGSVSANDVRSGCSTSCGNQSRFCSSVPARITGPWPRPFARIAVPIPEQPQESSSPISIPSNELSPAPPYSSGICTFMSPTSCARASTSAGCVEDWSYSRSFGRISRSANSWARSRSPFCSSVRANETPPVSPIVATLEGYFD